MSVTRRELLAALGVVSVNAVLPVLSSAKSPTSDLRINPDRLRESLEGLSVYGRPPGGTFADGVSRVAFSDADVAGRNYVMQRMREFDLEPRVDPAGNIFGARAGSQQNLKPILFGSHIDSVPSGGNFDGDLGSMSAIEIMHTLTEHGIITRHPLQMVIWTDEENTFAGSGAAAGVLRPGDFDRVRNGISLGDEVRKLGGDPTRLADARLLPGAFRSYLELHIEQGGFLYKANVPIGVVEGIVSIDQYDVEIRGFANHAGTTPMADRHNALLAAAKLVETVQNVVTQEPGRQVGTVGKLEVFPNAPNVVPGLVRHSIELRDLSAEKIARLGDEIQKRAQEVAKETGTEIIIDKVEHDPPAVAAPEIQEKIEAAAAELGLRTMRLPSGAGHDAQMMAKVGPIGMIFVPSVDGISHSPKEFTRWQDCANGANVLLQTILLVDRSST
jgi:beta-ureidopropionase / N-carbamoyl-L-amino-acid hydrolase